MDNLDKFIEKVKAMGNRIDYDWWKFGFQCNDLTRAWLQYLGITQYKPLGNNGCKLVALYPEKYLVTPLKRVKNDPKKPNQVPKRGDIVIFNIPKETGHIAIITGAIPWSNTFGVFEQNAWRWSTTWQWTDACILRTKSYNNVYWWITW